MKCSVCGNEVPEGHNFCSACGNPMNSAQQPVQPEGGFQAQPQQGDLQPQQPAQPTEGYQTQPQQGDLQPQQPAQPTEGYQAQQPAQPQQEDLQPQQPVQPMGGYQPQQPVQPMGGYQPQQPVQPMGGYQPQQPVQPTPQTQPMGGYQPQQPVQPMGGYQPQQPVQQPPLGAFQAQPQSTGDFKLQKSGISGIVDHFLGDVMNIVRLLGALIIFLAPFFTWGKYKISFFGMSESDHSNMFGLNDDSGLFTLYAIVILLVGLVLIAWEVADYIPKVSEFKAKVAAIPYIELILIAVVLLCVILALVNGDLNDVLKDIKDYGGKASHGAGPVWAFIGIILAAAPRILDILKIDFHFSIKK